METSLSPSILVVGSIAFDSIRTPFGNVDQALGGSGNFFSVAASFYVPVQILGIIGQDYPQSHFNWLSSRRIDVSGIEVVPGQSFHWAGSYEQNLREAKTLSTSLNVFSEFSPRLKDQHRNTDYLFLANIDPSIQKQVLDQVDLENTKLIACDSMNFWITSKIEELKQVLKKTDLLSVNETEAFLLSGERHWVRSAQIIRQMGPSAVIIKRGEFGAVLVTDSGIFTAPTYPTQSVVDPTGAGDSFAGAVMGYLSKNQVERSWMSSKPKAWDQALRRAVLAGCTMASFTVEDFSFRRLIRLTERELAEREADLQEMLRF